MGRFDATGYAIAAGTVLVATALRLVLDPFLRNEAPLLIYVLAVLAAGRFGGRGPGIAAALMSAMVGDYLFITPRLSLVPARTEDAVRLAVFTCESFAVVYLTEGQRRAYLQTLATTRELARHREELERQVHERTAALNASNEALQAFAYSMSHDLRAPLRAMSGYAKMVIEDHAEVIPTPGREHLARIAAGAERMERLIERLLAFNRVSRTDAAESATVVDLDDVLPEVLAALRTEIDRSGAEVAVDGPLPAAVGNYEAIRQVVLNLIDNALKFAAPGTAAKIRVRAERLGGIPPLLKVHIEDNGIGIREEDRRRIFEPFQRADAPAKGSGLGLAIVSRAVTRMGGTVGVNTRSGGGSDFWFTIPAARA
jgi:K+-sensing histidine kinase KdpD